MKFLLRDNRGPSITNENSDLSTVTAQNGIHRFVSVS